MNEKNAFKFLVPFMLYKCVLDLLLNEKNITVFSGSVRIKILLLGIWCVWEKGGGRAESAVNNVNEWRRHPKYEWNRSKTIVIPFHSHQCLLMIIYTGRVRNLLRYAATHITQNFCISYFSLYHIVLYNRYTNAFNTHSFIHTHNSYSSLLFDRA